MTPKKPRITTEATKAKLPRPKRFRFVLLTCSGCKSTYRVRGTIGKMNVHNCACGQSDQFMPLRRSKHESKLMPDVSAPRAIPCGEDAQRIKPWYEQAHTTASPNTAAFVVWNTPDIPYIPPITEPYPWPVRVLNWLDDAPATIRRWLGRTLRSLAAKVEP